MMMEESLRALEVNRLMAVDILTLSSQRVLVEGDDNVFAGVK